MRFLWPYMKSSRGLFLIAPFLMLISVFMDLIQPTLMAIIVDEGIAKNNPAIIRHYGALMVGTSFLGLFSAFLGFFLSARSTSETGARLREAAFQKVLTFSARELDHFSISTLIVRLTNDIAQVQNLLLSSQRIFIRAPFLVVGGLLMALQISPRLSLIFLLIIPLLVILIIVVVRRAMVIFPLMQEKLDHLNLISRETLIGMRVVKGFSAEDREAHRFNDANEGLRDWQFKAVNNTILMSPFAMIIVNYSIVAILWFGGYDVFTGALEVGKIMAFITYIMLILGAMMMSSMILMTVTRAQVSIDRIKEIMETESSLVSPPKGSEPIGFDITLHNVSFTFHEHSAPILENINLHIPFGQRLGIIGPTGSGKSTLLQLIVRLYDVTTGSIRLGGSDIRDMNLAQLHQSVGLIQQNPIVLSGSLRDNIGLAKPHITDQEIKEALDLAMAADLYEDKELGLDIPISQRGRDLSGGQKQRTAIARVLAKKAPILLIDDATSALDMLTEEAFLKHLDKSRNHQTQIIVAQRISTMQKCDRIVVLHEGKIESCGSHTDLLETSPIYRTIAISQLGEEVLDV